MTKFEMFDALRKYNDKLKHGVEYGKGFYNKIDNYYPDGTARYFYSQAEWEAYQDGLNRNKYEQDKKEKKVKEETAQKSNMTEYEKWQEGKKAEEDYKKTDSYKQEKAKQDEKNRIDKIKKDLKDTFSKGGWIYDNAAEVLKDTTEVKAFKSGLKEYLSKRWDTAGEDLKDRFKKITKREFSELISYINLDTNYKILKDLTKDVDDKIADHMVWNAYNEILDELGWKDRFESNAKSREEAERKGIEATRLSSDDPKVVQMGVDMKLADYLNDIETIGKNFELSKEERDKEKEASYYDFLSSMSKLRKTEEKNGFGIPLLATEMSVEETMKYINVGRRSGVDKISGGGNCRLCTLAMCLRMKGYDVSAPFARDADPGFNTGYNYASNADYSFMENIANLFTANTDSKKQNLRNEDPINKMFKKTPTVYSESKDKEKIKKTVSKQTNTYGFFDIDWNDRDFGHAMFYTVDGKGNIEVYDAQINKKVDLDEIMDRSYNYTFTRVDNLEPDWTYIMKNNWTVYY